jgi:hypothetical protein
MFDFIIVKEVCEHPNNHIAFRIETKNHITKWSKYLSEALNYKTKLEAEKVINRSATKGNFSKHWIILDKEDIDYLMTKRDALLPYQISDFEITNKTTESTMYHNRQENLINA